MFVDIIFAYFSGSDPDSGVTSYEVAWGSGPGLVDVSDFEEVINTTIWRAKVKEGALEKGKKILRNRTSNKWGWFTVGLAILRRNCCREVRVCL